MTYICAQVSTEGAIDEMGNAQSVSSSTSVSLTSIGTHYPIIAVRKKTTHRDIAAFVEGIGVYVTSNSDILRYLLVLNPTLSAPLTYSNTNTAIQVAAGNGTITATAGTGHILMSGFVSQNGLINNMALQHNFLAALGGTLANTMDEIVLIGVPITATIVSYGEISIIEY